MHHKVKMCLVLSETTTPSFKVAVPLACPPPTDERSCCSTSSIAFGGVCILDFRHPSMNHEFLTQLESDMCSRAVGGKYIHWTRAVNDLNSLSRKITSFNRPMAYVSSSPFPRSPSFQLINGKRAEFISQPTSFGLWTCFQAHLLSPNPPSLSLPFLFPTSPFSTHSLPCQVPSQPLPMLFTVPSLISSPLH